MRVKAYIHSLKDHEHERNVLGEAEIIECIGDNLYLAEYNGVRCTAFRRRAVIRNSVDSSRKFKVTITETLKMVVEVETPDQQEAEQIVSDGWHNSKYILDADNFVDVAFEAVPVINERLEGR